MTVSESEKSPRYNGIPKQVSRKDFNHYILPHLKKRVKGPKPKLSFYKIFNYILYVLHTGIQWDQLRTRRNELHWSNVYKWQNRWSGRIAGQKMVPMRTFFRHPSSTCLTPMSLTRHVFTEMVQTPS